MYCVMRAVSRAPDTTHARSCATFMACAMSKASALLTVSRMHFLQY